MHTTIIQQKYDAFVKKYQCLPKVVDVVIEWKDDHQQHNYFISLDDFWADDCPYPYRNTQIGRLSEEDIFYHAGSIHGLFDLIVSDCEDFNILDILDFY